LIEACRSAKTVHTTWLYVQPEQRPRRPKLEQSPFPPTCRLEYFSPPLLMRLMKDMVGYCVLNKLTDGLHRAGMKAFVVGLFACPACVAGAVIPDLDVGVKPRNAKTGHVRHSTMAQSSTSRKTVPPSADRGIGLPATHRSHAVKNCRASKWIRHNRWRQRTERLGNLHFQVVLMQLESVSYCRDLDQVRTAVAEQHSQKFAIVVAKTGEPEEIRRDVNLGACHVLANVCHRLVRGLLVAVLFGCLLGH
jgi:hypothetical protein